MISFILGTYNRPWHLEAFISHLNCQTSLDFELIVMDEGDNGFILSQTTRYPLKYYEHPYKGDWHQSSKEKGIKYAEGDYLCFPNDDCYYLPVFVEEVSKYSSEFIYFDWIWRDHGAQVHKGNPKKNYMDVGGFVVQKDKMPTWQDKSHQGDGTLIEDIVGSGVSTHYINKVLYVKN